MLPPGRCCSLAAYPGLRQAFDTCGHCWGAKRTKVHVTLACPGLLCPQGKLRAQGRRCTHMEAAQKDMLDVEPQVGRGSCQERPRPCSLDPQHTQQPGPSRAEAGWGTGTTQLPEMPCEPRPSACPDLALSSSCEWGLSTDGRGTQHPKNPLLKTQSLRWHCLASMQEGPRAQLG